MKNSFLPISFLLFLLSTTFISCKKDGGNTTDPGPDATYITNGFLCTRGIGYSSDSLAFFVATTGDQMWDYGSRRPRDEVSLITSSNGTMLIKLKSPYINTSGDGKSYSYIGIRPNPNPLISAFPHAYIYMFAPDDYDISELQFVVKRNSNDGSKFTIESKKYPGNYLGVAKWKNAVHPSQTRLVYTSEKKEFFLMTK